MKVLVVILASFFATLTIASAGFSSQAEALNGNDFPFGNIIDDAIFTNKNSMTVQQIQAFLESKVVGGSCDRNRPTYNPSYNPPWTCLFEFQQNPSTGQNNYGLFEANGSPSSVPGGKTAAEIIWQAGQDHDINPQVLIVLLQKEQGLVTDNWPWTIQYSRATGYLCPDTAPCDPSQADFYKQVDGAAKLFRYYLDNLDRYWYQIGENDILYNPNHSCGRKRINIENAATVALYLYTPYTPNQAALDNLYGTGDSCSAYGNRNFWRYFNDWFGSTKSDGYEVISISRKSYLIGDSPEQLTIKVKNLTGKTWYADGYTPTGESPVRLTTLGYSNIPFADQDDESWLGTSNQIRMVESQVLPNEIATFNATLKGSGVVAGVEHIAKFTVTIDGVKSYPFNNVQIKINKPVAEYGYSIVNVNTPPPVLRPGDSWNVIITVRNTGHKSWYSDNSPKTGSKIRLVNNGYSPTPYAYKGAPEWLGTSNQIRLLDETVKPGEHGQFKFKIFSPIAQTDYTHIFRLVLDGVATIQPQKSIVYRQATSEPDFSFTSAGAINPPANMSPGEVASATMQIKNTGNIVWRNEQTKVGHFGSMRLMMSKPNYRRSEFSDKSDRWLGTLNQVKMKEPYVLPGGTATFEFSWIAPLTTGERVEPFTFVLDGIKTLPNRGMQFTVNVN